MEKRRRRKNTKKRRRKRRTKKRSRKRRTKKRRRKRRGGGLEWFNKCITNLKTNVQKLLTEHDKVEGFYQWDSYGPNGSQRALDILPMFDYILSDKEMDIYEQQQSNMGRAELYNEIRRLVKCVVDKMKTKPEAYDPIVDTMTENRTDDSFDMKNPEHVVIVLVGRGGQKMDKW